MYSSTLAALLRRTAFRFLKACENVRASHPEASESDFKWLVGEEVKRLREAEKNGQPAYRHRPSPGKGSLEVKKE
jgi:hypothetical protein